MLPLVATVLSLLTELSSTLNISNSIYIDRIALWFHLLLTEQHYYVALAS